MSPLWQMACELARQKRHDLLIAEQQRLENIRAQRWHRKFMRGEIPVDDAGDPPPRDPYVEYCNEVGVSPHGPL